LKTKKRESKLQRENARNAYFEAKEKEKEQRKRKRQKLREKSISEAHLKKGQTKDSTKKEKPRRSSVTFVDTVQVKEFVPNTAPTSKKPKVSPTTKSKKEKRQRKKQRKS